MNDPRDNCPSQNKVFNLKFNSIMSARSARNFFLSLFTILGLGLPPFGQIFKRGIGTHGWNFGRRGVVGDFARQRGG